MSTMTDDSVRHDTVDSHPDDLDLGNGLGQPNIEPVDLDDPGLYLNRELSWIRFNERVLEEALDPRVPLLERVFFLSIFSSNLDEFFMIRVAGLRSQFSMGVVESPADGMTPSEQLSAIRRQLLPLLESAQSCWQDDLAIKLREEGIDIRPYTSLSNAARERLRDRFETEVFPILTPLLFDPSHPFPHISNLSLNLAVVIADPKGGERFARLKVPMTLPRLMHVPESEDSDTGDGPARATTGTFVWLEEVIVANLDLLFPGLDIKAAYPFRITRDADFEIEEDEASDLLKAMTEVVGRRHFGYAVRLEIDEAMPARIREILMQNLDLAPHEVFTSPGPLGRSDLKLISKLDRPDLKFPPFQPVAHPTLGDEDLFELMRERDYVLYHPYDSFSPVVELVRQAARDPDVVAIKQTLYRTGPNSPIVQALMEARENGKQVAVLVELKARFDEENNIVWAKQLERAGVHVVYGLLGLKTHAKVLLIVRREGKHLRRYLHLATGNYNPITARAYTDLGFLTTDEDLASDLTDLFNALTGYSRKVEYRKIFKAPDRMRDEMLARVEREIDRHRSHGDGHIVWKMNSLVDKASIQALYRASRAGVQIDLQVRGICCLRPGVPGISDTITVTSIVGRFLEHTRIYYFHNGGDEEILLGSADIMPRNLDKRVECLFPIENATLRDAIRDDILFLHLRDNQKLRLLERDGSYRRVHPAEDDESLDTQDYLLHQGGSWRSDVAS
ncbi:MAG: polyphosphate kinase 1 [Acidobacteriota bacterium]